MIALSGWTKQTNISALDFIKEIENFGVSRIIYTDINKDGTKKGPNIKDTVKLSNKVKIPFIISGGISSIEETPPEITNGIFTLLDNLMVSLIFGPFFVPSLFMSV